MKQLKHPNIIELIDVYHTETRLVLIFEYCPYDFKKYMEMHGERGALHPDEVLNFMHQLLTGIAFCHKNSVFHRDLKPQNLLVDHEKVLKIGDFGLAREFEIPVSTFSHEVCTVITCTGP